MDTQSKVLFFIFLLFASEFVFPAQARPLKVHEDVDLLNTIDHSIGVQLLEGIKIEGQSGSQGCTFVKYRLDGVKKSGPSPGDGH